MKKETLIKICGLTTCADIETVNENRPDFAGFVLFFPKSKRNNTIEHVKTLLPALSDEIKTVAVVVSPTLEQVKEIERTGFDYIQIHGTLEPSLLNEIRIPVLRAFNVTDMDQYETFRHYPRIAGFVFDAMEAGSGRTFDWNLIKNLPKEDGKLFLLAGGLHAGNVKEAILSLHPDGVDVSSGVEYEDRPGKDPEKIAAFCQKVRKYIE